MMYANTLSDLWIYSIERFLIYLQSVVRALFEVMDFFYWIEHQDVKEHRISSHFM